MIKEKKVGLQFVLYIHKTLVLRPFAVMPLATLPHFLICALTFSVWRPLAGCILLRQPHYRIYAFLILHPTFSGTHRGRKMRAWCSVIFSGFGLNARNLLRSNSDLFSKVSIINTGTPNARPWSLLTWTRRLCVRQGIPLRAVRGL
jgi:hypothetical protein